MGDIQTTATEGKSKGVKRRKLSTRVDLTPMVDLGFLLITFFIFTTALAKPTVMRLMMPDDRATTDPGTASASKTLTLLLGKDNRVFYYSGIFKGEVKEVPFNQLRSIIIEKKQQVFKKFGTTDVLVLIKGTNVATFKNIVDSLDEMIINGVLRYMLIDATAEELKAVK